MQKKVGGVERERGVWDSDLRRISAWSSLVSSLIQVSTSDGGGDGRRGYLLILSLVLLSSHSSFLFLLSIVNSSGLL